MAKGLSERFWEKVNKTETCWNWTAGQQGWGYGQFSYQGTPVSAHRFSWILAFGPVPNGLYICHKCDNRLCVRPEHLFLGTPEENNIDKRDKGRAAGPIGFLPEIVRKTGRGPARKSLAERFWRKVQKTDGCWIWTAATMHDGRGLIAIDHTGKHGSAPRVSWELHFGPIPNGMWVLHDCDNPRCVRPEHLFLGDASVNNLASVRKGRRKIPPLAGEHNPRAKLTARDARAIRDSEENASKLATQYGVSRGTIYHVRSGYTWAAPDA